MGLLSVNVQIMVGSSLARSKVRSPPDLAAMSDMVLPSALNWLPLKWSRMILASVGSGRIMSCRGLPGTRACGVCDA